MSTKDRRDWRSSASRERGSSSPSLLPSPVSVPGGFVLLLVRLRLGFGHEVIRLEDLAIRAVAELNGEVLKAGGGEDGVDKGELKVMREGAILDL